MYGQMNPWLLYDSMQQEITLGVLPGRACSEMDCGCSAVVLLFVSEDKLRDAFQRAGGILLHETCLPLMEPYATLRRSTCCACLVVDNASLVPGKLAAEVQEAACIHID